MIGSKYPGYVANIPYCVESDSEGETSSSEDSDDKFQFPDRYFNFPFNHFRLYPPEPKQSQQTSKQKPIQTLQPRNKRDRLDQENPNEKTSKKQRYIHRRGRVDNEEIQGNEIQFNGLNSPTTTSRKVFEYPERTLFKQLREETFGRTIEESTQTSAKRLRAVIGFNKMRSISNSRNKSLQEAVNRSANASPIVHVMGFLWDGVFQERSSTTAEWVDAPYEKVQNFYRQYKKKKGKEAAKHFRHDLEGKRSHLIPYRGIRETISLHPLTAQAVEALRNNQINEVYLAILDGDSISLKASDGRGVLSHYDELTQENIEKKKIPLEVASCGYLFNERDPIMRVASEIDLSIRHETAKFFKYGVYYPEPNFIIRVPPGANTIPYSFEGSDSKDYESPHESVIILEQVRQASDHPQDVAAFNASGAITTATPARAEKPFAAHYDQFRRIVRWTERDLKQIRGVSQSHFHQKKWAENLVRDLNLPKQKTMTIGTQQITIKYGKIQQMVKSLLTRLFSHYDVVTIAQKNLEKIKSQPGASFPSQFIRVLENYDPHLKPLTVVNKKRAANVVKRVWDKLDGINSITELKNQLAWFLSKNTVSKIERAVQQSAKSVLDIFKERFELDFPTLSLALMRDYVESLTEEEQCQEYTPTGVNRLILDNDVLNNEEGFKQTFSYILRAKDAADHPDPFSATPLHWAAITGNRKLIKILKKQIGKKEESIRKAEKPKQPSTQLRKLQSYYNLHAQTIGGAMPFHCALKYCADNANDMVLLEYLIDSTSADACTDDKMTPLVLALNELENPGPVVELICKHSERYKKYESILVPLLNKLHPIECREAMLLTLLYHLPPLPENLTLIKTLIRDGLKVDGCGFILEHHEPNIDYQLSPETLRLTNPLSIESLADEDLVSPIVLAVKTGDVELVKMMMDNGAPLSKSYDDEGNTPVIAAIESLDDKFLYPMLEQLCGDYSEEILEGPRGSYGDYSALHIVIEDNHSQTLFDFLLDRVTPISFDSTTLINLALEEDNAAAIEKLIESGFVNVDHLSPDITQAMRDLTGRRDIMCEEDREFMKHKREKSAKKALREDLALAGSNLNRFCFEADIEAIIDLDDYDTDTYTSGSETSSIYSEDSSSNDEIDFSSYSDDESSAESECGVINYDE